MQANPIVETQQETEAIRRQVESFRYPFKVVCVYLEEADFPIVREVHTFCTDNRLVFSGRPYNPDKYSEDVMIHRLPAFHVYLKGYVQETHYFDMNPVHKLQLRIWEYQDECMAKEMAKLRRQEKWEAFKGIFDLERFKPKRALDLDASLHKNLSHKNHTH